MVNPAGDELRARMAELPPAERAAAEAAIGGPPKVSLAMPGQPVQAGIATIDRTTVTPSGANQQNLSNGVLDRLKRFCTATKESATPDEVLFISKGLISVSSGYAVITAKGIGYLVDFGLL